MFRDPVYVTFVDQDNAVLAETAGVEVVPRAGENVRIAGVPYVVERVGYDLPSAPSDPRALPKAITRIWIVCQPA